MDGSRLPVRQTEPADQGKRDMTAPRQMWPRQPWGCAWDPASWVGHVWVTVTPAGPRWVGLVFRSQRTVTSAGVGPVVGVRCQQPLGVRRIRRRGRTARERPQQCGVRRKFRARLREKPKKHAESPDPGVERIHLARRVRVPNSDSDLGPGARPDPGSATHP